jgi:hypothetical protein
MFDLFLFLCFVPRLELFFSRSELDYIELPHGRLTEDSVEQAEVQSATEQAEELKIPDAEKADSDACRCTRGRAMAGMLLLGTIITAIVMWQTGQFNGASID